MSGSALTSVALKRNSKQSFQQQAEFLNCSANIPSQEVVDCLRTKSVEEIVNSSTRFYVSFFFNCIIKIKYIQFLKMTEIL